MDDPLPIHGFHYIQAAIRQGNSMSADLGRPISSGRTAEIFNWDEEHVLKLFFGWVELEKIENEAHISAAVYGLGLPVPEITQVVQIEDRHGLVLQRIRAVSMYRLAQRKPWNVIRYLRRSAELQAEIHSHSILKGLPSQRQILERNISRAAGLPGHLRVKALAALEALPDGNQLCHGDFWGGNILMDGKREVIIDWHRASCGNPLADLARTSNAALAYLRTNQMRRAFLSYGTSKASRIKNPLFRWVVRLSYPVYLRRYFQLHPGGEEEYRRWMPVVAAARLSDEIPEMDGMLIEQVEKYL